MVDVRIRHADLPQANSDAIYRRMKTEREREAAEYRAEGSETAQRIKARAQREVTVLTAEATRESEICAARGDAEKTRILGQAFSQDPDFFAFWRTMQAYQDSLGDGKTTVVLSPDSDFLKYFGRARAGSSLAFTSPAGGLSTAEQSRAPYSLHIPFHRVRQATRVPRFPVRCLSAGSPPSVCRCSWSPAPMPRRRNRDRPSRRRPSCPSAARGEFRRLAARLLPMVVNIATTQTLKALPSEPACRTSRRARRSPTCSELPRPGAKPAASCHVARLGFSGSSSIPPATS
ncbi:MAG: hypothetical protein WDM81_03920 [Rhizomicrobium sp.]